ncbi:NAD(P)/FAD-dependent oxidoreductase [Halomicrococcus gelatinilyticus]|uniref:NAD(P)/FAD-dependent oxidoreductase n=1 Tax=Halomicrococcus gelatinilyticus TaxID=1702103 RepID=UPI002E0EC0CC
MKVAVLGAGYAGLTLARRLEQGLPDDVDLVVVEETGEHLVQHELHRVVRWPSLRDDITIPLDQVLDCEVLKATVESVDVDRNRVELHDGGFAYDYAAVCLGATTAFYDLPGVAEHATPLKRIEHAQVIRSDFLDVLDGKPEDGEEGDGAVGAGEEARVVVGGAGLSGVQVAGELAALAREQGGDPDAGRPEILLLEQLDHVAPAFPGNFQSAVREQLERRGVVVRTGATVERATADAVDLVDGRVEYDQFVWTGGIRGPEALDGERPLVRSDLRLGDGTFAVGDAARVVDGDGESVPASAQAAIREARVVAANLLRLVEHDRGGDDLFEPRLDPFTFDSPGWLVSVGDGAVAQVGPTVLTGTAAKALKATVGAGYLSSVGAVRNAAELVGEEVGWSD